VTVPNIYADSQEALVVGLAQAGDQAAFAELVRRRQSWIRNLMRRCSGDITLADDLSQQVFLQAWRKIRQLRQANTFAGWLKRLAITTWLQHQRKNDALYDAADYEDTPLAQPDTTSLAMDLDQALSLLVGPVRLCVVLSYHECMSHGEIAKLTELPLGTVKSHIRRGTLQLQQLLAAYQDTPREEESS
jgi:RNA polymerase sigma factor (sigma-70 family)